MQIPAAIFRFQTAVRSLLRICLGQWLQQQSPPAEPKRTLRSGLRRPLLLPSMLQLRSGSRKPMPGLEQQQRWPPQNASNWRGKSKQQLGRRQSACRRKKKPQEWQRQRQLESAQRQQKLRQEHKNKWPRQKPERKKKRKKELECKRLLRSKKQRKLQPQQ
jgi:hypothetical protein